MSSWQSISFSLRLHPGSRVRDAGTQPSHVVLSQPCRSRARRDDAAMLGMHPYIPMYALRMSSLAASSSARPDALMRPTSSR